MGSYQSVDIHVVSDNQLETPVEGVLVRIFDANNVTFFTEATTNSAGVASFTLYTQTYNLRFYKFGAQVNQPLIIEVEEPAPGETLINAFTATATVFSHPVANDARLCRASGFFRDITGAPHAYVDLVFTGQFNPLLLEGNAVLNEKRKARTDKDGFACIDLIRCAKYDVSMQDWGEDARDVSVPDAPSVNLPDLLFPVVQAVSFDQDSPYSMLVGDVLTLETTVVTSAGVPLDGPATGDVIWSSSDPSVISIGYTSTGLILTALSAGTAEITVVRSDNSIVRIPAQDIEGLPFTVTVA